MIRYPAIVLLLGLLTACFGGGEVIPQDQFYQLGPIGGDIPKVSNPLGVVAVSALQSDALHHERSILYSEQSAPLQVSRYHYHLWTDVPGQLLQEQLIAYLRKAGFAHEVIRYGEQAHIDAQITGYIHRFERVLGQGNPKIIVRLELSFIARTSGAQRHVTKEYTLERETTDSSMHASVRAFSDTLQEIYLQFLTDITQ